MVDSCWSLGKISPHLFPFISLLALRELTSFQINTLYIRLSSLLLSQTCSTLEHLTSWYYWPLSLSLTRTFQSKKSLMDRFWDHFVHNFNSENPWSFHDVCMSLFKLLSSLKVMFVSFIISLFTGVTSSYWLPFNRYKYLLHFHYINTSHWPCELWLLALLRTEGDERYNYGVQESMFLVKDKKTYGRDCQRIFSKSYSLQSIGRKLWFA